MIFIRILAATIVVGWSLAGIDPADARQADFFVSPSGNDAWSGTLPEPNTDRTDGPFRTITRARDAIRGLKTAARINRPMTVCFRDGAHFLSEPFVLKPVDSGTRENPVTYAAYPGEKPVLSGGRCITGWKQGPGNLWTAELSDVKTGRWYFRQLFVNNRRARRARLPNKGYHHLTGLIEPENREAPVNRTGFRFRPGEIKSTWPNLEDVEVVKLFRWSETRMRVAAVDDARSVVTFTGQTGPNPRLFDWSGGRYYIENVEAGLDSPGEWYLNRTTGTLSYWPLPGEEIKTAQAIAGELGQLVRFEGNVENKEFVQHVCFSGLTFAHSDWQLPKAGLRETQAAVHISGQNPPEGYPSGAVLLKGAHFCRLEKCQITHVGAFAIEIGRGSKDTQIVGNQLNDLGAGGIKIGSPISPKSDAEEAGRTLVCDNIIHDCGHVNLGAVAIWVGQSGGNRIAHNEIFDSNYSGISMGWNWGCTTNRAKNNIVEFNHIHHLMRVMDDGGGIYVLGVSPGTVLRNNLIHDIYGHGPLGRGIYLDQGACHIRVENNIIYNTKNSFCAGYGNNIFQNNIFVSGSGRQIWHSGGPCTPVGNRFKRNIVAYSEPSASFITLYEIDSLEKLRASVAESDYNVFFPPAGGKMGFENFGQGQPVVGSYTSWQELGYDAHSVVADPMFVDAENDVFDLKPESPALKLGFVPIDISQIGPRGTSRDNDN